MTKAAYGWMVEVSHPADGDQPLVQRYNIAEPSRRDAIASVRRRIPRGDTATVEAVAMLSSYTVHTVLRLKRGEMMQVT